MGATLMISAIALRSVRREDWAVRWRPIVALRFGDHDGQVLGGCAIARSAGLGDRGHDDGAPHGRRQCGGERLRTVAPPAGGCVAVRVRRRAARGSRSRALRGWATGWTTWALWKRILDFSSARTCRSLRPSRAVWLDAGFTTACAPVHETRLIGKLHNSSLAFALSRSIQHCASGAKSKRSQLAPWPMRSTTAKCPTASIASSTWCHIPRR